MEIFTLLPEGYQILISDYWLRVSILKQRLFLNQGSDVVCSWSVSTSRYGIGNVSGSQQTPLGWHLAWEWIGQDQPLYTVFKSRIPTGKICNPNQEVSNDVICTRIIWLKGLQAGMNQGGNVDSFDRYIYIHGTNDENSLGRPSSIGCVRMGSSEIIELFHYQDKALLVYIDGHEKNAEKNEVQERVSGEGFK